MTIKEFVKKYEITLTHQETVRNPLLRNPDFIARHFECTLHRGPEELAVPLSIGLGTKECPTTEMVLEAMAVAAIYIEGSTSYESWLALIGRTPFHIPVEAYLLYKSQTDNLRQFLGQDAYLDLLTNTMRVIPPMR